MPLGHKLLVVGADSFIGCALAKGFQDKGRKVLGTSRREDNVNSQSLFLDLSKDESTWKFPDSIDTAVICAGISKIEICRKNPIGTFEINVRAIIQLVKRLLDKNIFVVYLSSSQVFDGNKERQESHSLYRPLNEYGRQKALAEEKILALSNQVSVLRLTKVLGRSNNIFVNWAKALRNKEEIFPFEDLLLAPVPLKSVIDILEVIIQKRIKGVIQVSSDDEIFYAQAAYFGAKLLNCDKNLVHPVKSKDSGHYFEDVPLHASLDTERLKKELDIHIPSAKWTIEKVFLDPTALI